MKSGVPLAVALALLLLRLWTGLFFLDAAKWKLIDLPKEQGLSFGQAIDDFVSKDYVPMVQGAIADPPAILGTRFTGFSSFLENVMLPAREFFGPAILFAEVLLGLSLVLGAGVRLSAALGALMMLAFSLAKRLPDTDGGVQHLYFFTASSANWPVTLILVALCLAAAGRFLGLDARLRHRLPGWVRWTT